MPGLASCTFCDVNEASRGEFATWDPPNNQRNRERRFAFHYTVAKKYFVEGLKDKIFVFARQHIGQGLILFLYQYACILNTQLLNVWPKLALV